MNALASIGRRAGIGTVLLAVPVLLFCWFAPFPSLAIKEIGYSQTVLDKDGNILRVFLGSKGRWLLPVELSEINPNLVNATIAIEDKRFWNHHGVDPLAVLRSAWLNITHRKILTGASTLSMQVIRLLEDRPRTFPNKVIEAVHALWLETVCSKKDILKLYFELAPYGGNIHGVKAAAWRYFKKHPKDLTLEECALLAGIPQSPSRLRPDRHPERAKKRRNMVLNSMLVNKYIAQKQFDVSNSESVEARHYSFPFAAPHFGVWVHKKYPAESILKTSLNPLLQDMAEKMLKDRLSELSAYGVQNGAVVILENKTGKIRALVGSNDFFDKDHSGQVNGALSKRSPGSCLKPFTYAIGFDLGLYTPRMILADVPVQYQGYAPLDYSKKYRGPVTVRESLADSLNVPAVEVLQRVGYQKLYAFLKQSGNTTLTKQPEQYGLSLTLGTAEVRLLELVNAYAVLARLGAVQSYTGLESTPLGKQDRLMSEGSAYLVADILEDSERLASSGFVGNRQNLPRVAWKTGTSYGNHDAWTVAYNPEYTIGVWLGNFSGKPSKSLVGIEAAAPVALRLFERIYAGKPSPWFEKPAAIGIRRVCLLSGEPVSGICPHSAEDLFIIGRTMDRQCSVHKKFMIDNDTGLAVDEVAKGHSVSEKVCEVWPQAIHTWLEQHDSNYISPPIMENGIDMARDWEGANPKILSPVNQCEYYLDQSRKTEQRLILRADGSYDARKLFWFINGQYVNEGRAGEGFFWPMREGRQRITVTDDYGRSSSIMITIR
ncbi:MAG: penicillin-binding protein 1C [Candidatus Omnitrophota bacterium]